MLQYRKKGGTAMTGTCDDCVYNTYDDETDEAICDAYIDEDELFRLLERGGACPYYRSGDDYELVRHQN